MEGGREAGAEEERETEKQRWREGVGRKRPTRHHKRQRKWWPRGRGERQKAETKQNQHRARKAGRKPRWGREGYVLLNEDFHQVDVATGGRRMQGRP